jgi:hypothetical protein
MTRLQSLLRRFSSLSSRERAGVSMATAVAGLATFMSLFDLVIASRGEAIEAKEALSQAEASLRRDADAGFQRLVSEEVNKVWRWSVVDTSEGLVRAQTLTLLEGVVAEAGLADVEIVLGELEQTSPAVGVVRARVAASFEWSSFNALLGALANADESVVVERIDVSGGGDDGQTLVVDLATPFVLESSS